MLHQSDHFQRIDKEMLLNYINVFFSSFRCKKVDYPLIKFEPRWGFNFEEQIYGFKAYWVFHTLILSAQRWYGINVKRRIFYSISAQRWYRIELKVLIVVFSDKDLRVVLLEGTKEDELSTCDSERKKTVPWESVFSLKNCLKSKVTENFDPIKENRAVRDFFEKCLLCTLYQVEFILSSFKVVISHTCLIWPTSDEACVSWNI